MEEINLRTYRRSDLPGLVALDRACFAPEFHFEARAMRRFAEAPGACSLLAESSAGDLAGFVIAHLERTAVGDPCGYCLTLDVRATERGQGLGERLLRAAEQEMATRGATVMSLHVWTGNRDAIRLYERLGYTFLREIPAFYGPGFDALLYRKEIVRSTA